jgi:hypothetical protein
MEAEMKDIESKVAELMALVRKPAYYDADEWEAFKSALRTALESASRLPDGWVAVPVEPTQEMISVAIARGCAGDYNEGIWAAMLAAAPKVDQ